jgi:hypothetical protein
MRLALVLVVALIVAACALQQSSAERNFVRSESARGAQAALDAEAIMRGMAQARDSSQWVARDLRQTNPGATPPSVTR